MRTQTPPSTETVTVAFAELGKSERRILKREAPHQTVSLALGDALAAMRVGVLDNSVHRFDR